MSFLRGFPKNEASKVTVTALITFLTNDDNKDKYGLIEIVLEQEEDIYIFKKYLDELSHK